MLVGDSDLFISFLNGQAKMGRREFAANVEEVKRIVKLSHKSHHFKWVPRREN